MPAAGYYWLAFETGVSDKSAQGLMPVGAPHRLKIIDFGDNGVWAPEGKIGIGVRILRPPDDTKREIAVALTSGALVRGGANAVPEPGDWALMLVGLGVVGTAIRRRRNLATAT